MLSGPADLTSGTFEAISFFGSPGLAVGHDPANSRALVLRIGAENSLEWGGAPGFVEVNDGMLVTPTFAIVAGAREPGRRLVRLGRDGSPGPSRALPTFMRSPAPTSTACGRRWHSSG